MKIYLIRHSESIDDIENCYGGIADFDLSENGKSKVKEYKKDIDKYGIERIYTSPYKRAYQTAQILNKDIKVELKVIEDIRELNSYGILSGINKELAKNIFSYVLQKEEYKNTGYYFGKTFLGGEDIEEFDKRVKDAINFIIKDSKDLHTIAIVTHGNVHKSIFKNILKVDKEIEKIDDVATTILEYDNGEFKIIETIGIELGRSIK
ncbi:MAG: histidine phosphatase family protein [Clostridia bacterium]|nr:histidine phosphatase family protein [Clostridia bacterium]